jgi:trimeric autotransporter adhesin
MKENSIMKNRNITFTAILLGVVSFALCQQVQAQETPDPASTCAFCTADGTNALANATGSANSAFGWFSLFSNTDASFNTAVGAGSLLSNNGNDNTAVGTAALLFNSTGVDNVAVGAAALVNNADGSDNNAVGAFALQANVSGTFNNAHGHQALVNNDGSQNNAMGDLAMFANTTGSFNTAVGDDALFNCVDGNSNVAIGDEAGTSIVSASNMVAIGVTGAGPFADTSNTCFIGSIFDQPVSDAGTAQDTFVDQFNVLGFLPSSRRFKHDIKPMDNASEAILALKPVSFKYNSDKKGTTQYGLIAEEVAEVAPDLVFRDKNGDVQTVRSEQINMMLLNEFLKEHKKVQNLETTVAQQQKGMEVLTAQLKEQAAQIQKVSAQVEVNKPTPQTVANK